MKENELIRMVIAEKVWNRKNIRDRAVFRAEAALQASQPGSRNVHVNRAESCMTVKRKVKRKTRIHRTIMAANLALVLVVAGWVLITATNFNHPSWIPAWLTGYTSAWLTTSDTQPTTVLSTAPSSATTTEPASEHGDLLINPAGTRRVDDVVTDLNMNEGMKPIGFDSLGQMVFAYQWMGQDNGIPQTSLFRYDAVNHRVAKEIIIYPAPQASAAPGDPMADKMIEWRMFGSHPAYFVLSMSRQVLRGVVLNDNNELAMDIQIENMQAFAAADTLEKVAYIVNDQGRCRLYVAGADLKNPVEILQYGTMEGAYPQLGHIRDMYFTPDGETLAFRCTVAEKGSVSGADAVGSIHIDGSGLKFYVCDKKKIQIVGRTALIYDDYEPDYMDVPSSGIVRLYDIDTGEIKEFQTKNLIESRNAWLSRDEKHLITLLDTYPEADRSDVTLRIYDMETGEKTYEHTCTFTVSAKEALVIANGNLIMDALDIHYVYVGFYLGGDRFTIYRYDLT